MKTSKVLGSTHHHIKNGADYKQKIEPLKFPRSYQLASIDIVFMFINMLRELMLDIVKIRWNVIRKNTYLTLSLFLEGIIILFDHVNFSFNGTKCKKTQGTPMSSPVSPALYELVIEHIDRIVMENWKNSSINVLFDARYADDSLLVAYIRRIHQDTSL